MKLRDIASKIDFTINNLNQEKDVSKIYDYYKNNQLKEYNILKSQLSYNEYVNVLEDILVKIDENISSNNEKEVITLLSLFIDLFNIVKYYKHLDTFVSLHSRFLDLYKKFNSEDEENIEKVKSDVISYINKEISFFDIKKLHEKIKLKYIKNYVGEIFIDLFLGDNVYEDFVITDILYDITVSSWKLVRKDKKSIDDLYKELDRLVNFILKNNFDIVCTHKIRSLSTLKNDMMLQRHGLSEKQLEIYKEETLHFINNDLLYSVAFDRFDKSFESLIKIQFASHLLNKDESLVETFDILFDKYIYFTYIGPGASDRDFYENIDYKILITRYYTIFNADIPDPYLIRRMLFEQKIFRYYNYIFPKNLFMFIISLFFKSYKLVYNIPFYNRMKIFDEIKKYKK